jgi:hypothetical protein
LQSCAVFVDAIQHYERNEEDHPRRRKLPLRQNAMNQAPVNGAVSIQHKAGKPVLEQRSLSQRGPASHSGAVRDGLFLEDDVSQSKIKYSLLGLDMSKNAATVAKMASIPWPWSKILKDAPQRTNILPAG